MDTLNALYNYTDLVTDLPENFYDASEDKQLLQRKNYLNELAEMATSSLTDLATDNGGDAAECLLNLNLLIEAAEGLIKDLSGGL